MSSLAATTTMTNATDLASSPAQDRPARHRPIPRRLPGARHQGPPLARADPGGDRAPGEIDKSRRSLESRLQRARIGRFKPIADFDWNWPKKIERDLIERALTPRLRPRGPQPRADRHQRPGQDHDRQEHRPPGRPRRLLRPVHHRRRADRGPPRRARPRPCAAASPATPGRTCSPSTRSATSSYDSHAADLLYKVVDRRYERPGAKDLPSRSILITTNLAFRDWNTVFPNATSIATLLDKLTHHADVTLIEGESYRVHESQKEAAARRKKKS